MPATARHLYLLRHAKSSWDDQGLDDHARPLNARGRRAADLLRDHLRREGIRPTLVLCSTARRARETLERVKPVGVVEFEPELYGATEKSLIERLKRVPEEADSVMVIGHNPTMQQVLLTLTGGDGTLAEKFPTAALATLTFDAPWSELGPERAELSALVRPKDLE
jgi:phosphohistidine phosphatase